MSGLPSPAGWVGTLGRELRQAWGLHQLRDPAWRRLFDAPPPGQGVVLHCATSGFDPRSDQVLALAAVPLDGQRLLTSQRLLLRLRPERPVPEAALRRHGLRPRDLAEGLAPEEALRRLLALVGPRPLVGHFLDDELALLNRLARPLLGVPLPQRRTDVATLYQDWRLRQLPPHQQQGGAALDLRLAAIARALDLPARPLTDPLDRAVQTGLAFIRLRRLGGPAA